MPDERLVLEYGGSRYQRSKGGWIDLRTHTRVPNRASAELDGEARKDTGFWLRCREQDVRDDPRHRGIVFRPVAAGEGLELTVVDRMPRRGHQSVHQPRRSSQVDHRWDGGGSLIVTADLSVGWRPTEAGWLFGGGATAELRNGFKLRLRLTLHEDSWNCHRWTGSATANPPRVPTADVTEDDEVHPEFSPLGREQHGIHLSLEGSRCALTVPVLCGEARELNPLLPWQESGRVWEFTFTAADLRELPFRAPASGLCVSRPFRLEFRARLQEPPREPLAPTREYDTPHASAGLPSLGRRR